jgi:ABC-2 type transport system permease protein
MYVGVFVLTKKSFDDNHATIFIIDEEGSIAQQLQDDKSLTFVPINKDLNATIAQIRTEESKNSILLIPKDFRKNKRVEVLSTEKPNIQTQHEIQGQLAEILRKDGYEKLGIDIDAINSINTNVQILAKQITAEGDTKDSNTQIAMGIAMALAVLVYISLFLYGAQVMRGVIEEKSNRIVEVIISSVRPFQLMMGKIVGIGLVGLTQFALWLLLSGILFAVASATLNNPGEISSQMSATNMADVGDISTLDPATADILSGLQNINYLELICTFFIFFVGGYLIYSALFAAVGSAVDSETEANQFTFPITMPLLLTYMLSFGVLVNDPNGSIATWLSFIPFTSPIAMIVRVPFGVPTWQIIVSAILLIGGFLFTTWIAARIYRVGILMHGKKASFKELLKWLKYRG